MAEITPQPGTEPNNIPDAEVTAPVKTTFGFASYGLPTPKWASAVFDLYFIVSKALIGWLAATKLLPMTDIVEATFFVTLFLDPIVKGMTKMFGVQVMDLK